MTRQGSNTYLFTFLFFSRQLVQFLWSKQRTELMGTPILESPTIHPFPAINTQASISKRSHPSFNRTTGWWISLSKIKSTLMVYASV